MATATATRVPREILEDRLHGLLWVMNDRGTEEEPTELWQELSSLLFRVATGVSRNEADDLGFVVEEAHAALESTILSGIERDGLAR